MRHPFCFIGGNHIGQANGLLQRAITLIVDLCLCSDQLQMTISDEQLILGLKTNE